MTGGLTLGFVDTQNPPPGGLTAPHPFRDMTLRRVAEREVQYLRREFATMLAVNTAEFR